MIKYFIAPDIKENLDKVLFQLDFPHIKSRNVICFRSYGSKARARARIWSFPKIWQLALGIEAHYCIEVISHNFDHLSKDDKIKILIHELLHIPKNFSGALLPHRGRGRVKVDNQTVNKLFKQIKKQ